MDVKFSYVPRNMTLARMIRINKLPNTPQLAESGGGLREMEEKDVAQVADLFTKYMQRFDMVPLMTIEEAQHQFLSGRGIESQDSQTGRRTGQVTWSYVVEVRQ